jgi:lipoprotein signal peptidase
MRRNIGREYQRSEYQGSEKQDSDHWPLISDILLSMTLFITTAAASLVASLAAKFLADAYLDERIAIIGSFAGLQHSLNPGIAFGLRLPSGIQEVLILAALVFVCVLAWKSARGSTTLATGALNQVGYGLITGGALGNVIDRLPDGFVTDFFQVGSFPIFNVADSCITIGVLLLLAEMMILTRGKNA